MISSLPPISRLMCTFLVPTTAGSSSCLMQRRTARAPSHPPKLQPKLACGWMVLQISMASASISMARSTSSAMAPAGQHGFRGPSQSSRDRAETLERLADFTATPAKLRAQFPRLGRWVCAAVGSTFHKENGDIPAQNCRIQLSFLTPSGQLGWPDQQKGPPTRAPFFMMDSTVRQPARPPHCAGGCAARAIVSRPPDSAPASADTGRAASWGRRSRRGWTRRRSSA